MFNKFFRMKTNKSFCVLILLFILERFYAVNAHRFFSKKKYSAIFTFGDSSIDTGANDFLHTTLKSNYYPYGINFPTKKPNGRFSDGLIFPDMFASHLGIKDLVPSFLDPHLSEKDLLTGVNFASSGSGFDDLTTVYSNSAPVSEQIFFFRHYLEKISRIVGEDEARKIIGNSIVIISAGSYDWILNYYNPPSIRKMSYDFNGYSSFLINKTQGYVQELYDLGCRTIVVAGLPPIGCLPIQIYVNPPSTQKNSCVLNQLIDAFAYNRFLCKMIARMGRRLRTKILYADIYSPLLDMSNHPWRYGIKETKKGCCNQEGLYKAYMCDPKKPCENPSEYIYWDNIHPTETTHRKLAQMLENAYMPLLQ